MLRLHGLLSLFVLTLCLSCKRDSITFSGLTPIKEYGKWGYINFQGKVVIPCEYDIATFFSEGLAAVKIDSMWGYIDSTGKIVIPPKYIYTTAFSDALAAVQMANDPNTYFIKKNGSIAFRCDYKNVGGFSSGKLLVDIGGEKCFIDKNGNVIIRTHYPYGSDFKEGIAKIWTRDSTKFIDTLGGVIRKWPDYVGINDFSEGLAYVRTADGGIYINANGGDEIVLKNDPNIYSAFHDGLSQSYNGDFIHPKYGFINKKGKVAIPMNFSFVNDFSEGLAAFRENDKWGFINKKGEVIIKPTIDWVAPYSGRFKNGLCWVAQGNQRGYIDHSGKFVWKDQSRLQYEKIDLLKWKLDTLNINLPMRADKNVGWRYLPKKNSITRLHDLILIVDTNDLTVFADKYFAFKLYLVNASKDTVTIPMQDRRLKIVQQAKNKQGNWQDIEYFNSSFCGNSYYKNKLASNYMLVFPAPIYKGDYKTHLRFKLVLDEKIIYSNSIVGRINKNQFAKDEPFPRFDQYIYIDDGSTSNDLTPLFY